MISPTIHFNAPRTSGSLRLKQITVVRFSLLFLVLKISFTFLSAYGAFQDGARESGKKFLDGGKQF